MNPEGFSSEPCYDCSDFSTSLILHAGAILFGKLICKMHRANGQAKTSYLLLASTMLEPALLLLLFQAFFFFTKPGWKRTVVIQTVDKNKQIKKPRVPTLHSETMRGCKSALGPEQFVFFFLSSCADEIIHKSLHLLSQTTWKQNLSPTEL